MLEKFTEAAKTFLGLTDWVKDLEIEAPVVDDKDTIALTHAYRHMGDGDMFSGADGFDHVRWLELRRNDSAGTTFMSPNKPAFSFVSRFQAIGRDRTKVPMSAMEAVEPLEKLEPGKYTLFMRRVFPKEPSLGAFFFLDVPHSEALNQTTVEKMNIDLPEALQLMRRFERGHRAERLNDTIDPSAKHYSALMPPAAAHAQTPN